MKIIETQEIAKHYNNSNNKNNNENKAKKTEEKTYETSFLKVLLPEMQRNNCIKFS